MNLYWNKGLRDALLTERQTLEITQFRNLRISAILLSFRVREDRFVQFGAVGNRENLDFLCLPSIFEQDRMVRDEGLLDSTVIHKPSRVLHRCSATRTGSVLIFQPQDAQCLTADVVARFEFVLVEQLDYVQVQPFLLLLADEGYG